jgi:hypothetical protein
MRQAFAHEATLVMEPEADTGAPGAAITTALCGHWEHEPPCPLAPHHTRAERVGREVHIRTLFAAEPDVAGAVRQRIEDALANGQLQGPDGAVTRWRLGHSQHSAISAAEADHAERLIRT